MRVRNAHKRQLQQKIAAFRCGHAHVVGYGDERNIPSRELRDDLADLLRIERLGESDDARIPL